MMRRVLAGLAVLLAALLVLLRPGANAPDPGAGADGQSQQRPQAQESASQDPLDSGTLGVSGLPGVGAATEAASAQEAGAGTAARATPRGAITMPGSASLPAGTVGVVVPVPDSLAARLRAGDAVDVYAAGSSRLLAAAAAVVDVTRPDVAAGGAGASEVPEPMSQSKDSSLLLAIRPADASRITAGQRAAADPYALIFALRPRAPDRATSATP